MAIRVKNAAGVYETLDSGFWATDADTFYVTPTGRVWHVQSEDDLGSDGPVKRLASDLDGLGLQSADGLLTVEEAIEHCERIERDSGETLVTN